MSERIGALTCPRCGSCLHTESVTRPHPRQPIWYYTRCCECPHTGEIGTCCCDCGAEIQDKSDMCRRMADETAEEITFADAEIVPIYEIICRACDGD